MHDTMLSAIDTFYDCVGEGYQYERATESFSEATEGTGFLLSRKWPLLNGERPLAFCNFPDDSIDAFVDAKLEVESHEFFKHFLSIPELVPVLRRSLICDEEHFQTQAYHQIIKPWGFHSEGVSILRKDMYDGLSSWFARHPGQGEIGYELLAKIAILNKHLTRAIGLQGRMDFLEQSVLRANSALDLVDFGLILYGGDDVPLFINKLGQTICDDCDGIQFGKSGLIIRDRQAQKTYRELLGKIFSSKTPSHSQTGGIIRVPRISSRKPYSLMVVPLSQGNKNMQYNANAAVLIFEPYMKKNTTSDLFRSSYDLTASEAKLALELTNGVTLAEYSQKRNISINTARTQLRSIFRKTETSRQPELVSLLMRTIVGMNLNV
ncbi:MAG: helix-turn-helix transcriptional regulator [Hyphomicrobiales bacterium]